MAPHQTEVADCSLLLIYIPRKDERLSRRGWLKQRTVYARKWSPVSCRSSTGEGKFAQHCTHTHAHLLIYCSRTQQGVCIDFQNFPASYRIVDLCDFTQCPHQSQNCYHLCVIDKLQSWSFASSSLWPAYGSVELLGISWAISWQNFLCLTQNDEKRFSNRAAGSLTQPGSWLINSSNRAMLALIIHAKSLFYGDKRLLWCPMRQINHS